METYPTRASYDLSLDQMIAAGMYDLVDSGVTAKNFPVVKEGVMDIYIHLPCFDRVMDRDDALYELDQVGLRAADIVELLAFGKQYPNLQREFPIIALNSVWQAQTTLLGPDREGSRSVPQLWGHSNARRLDLYWLAYRWRKNFRLAAVNK